MAKTKLLSVACCVFSFILLQLYTIHVEGTVSIIDGQTFRSRQDNKIGLKLVRGYEYMGRLQYISNNPTLCSSEHPYEQFDIVPTSDGLPVALIAQGGGCSIKEKASIAARMINPKNQVQYLIIQDKNKHHKYQARENVSSNNKDNQDTSFLREMYNDVYDALLIDNDLNDISKRLLETEVNDDDAYYVPDDHSIDLAVLHVSHFDGQKIFNLIDNEDAQVVKVGGMRIILNSKEWNVTTKTVVFWMVSTIFFCGCFCCCVLALVQSSFEEETTQEAPVNRRPARRRLTIEQVRMRFPAFHFNLEEHSQNCCPLKFNPSNEDAAATEIPLQQHSFCQLLDECTICLDEFTPGVKCRKLPCGHVFHSTCIARWFSRSAVCPLCKLDLYEEDDDGNELSNDSGSHDPESNQRNQGQNEEMDILIDRPTENNTVSESSRSWWPFSFESNIQNESEDENIVYNRSSGYSFFSEIMDFFRLRREQHPSSDMMLTELTEPLVSSEDQVEERNYSELALDTNQEDELSRNFDSGGGDRNNLLATINA